MLFVSSVVAWEYTDLRLRKRVSAPETIETLQTELGFELLDLPATIWADLQSLPVLHRDPMDRMLVSHARLAKLTLVTADATLRRYPVETLW
jgi:PIN domain nuclease of toxin-antitoxin system